MKTVDCSLTKKLYNFNMTLHVNAIHSNLQTQDVTATTKFYVEHFGFTIQYLVPKGNRDGSAYFTELEDGTEYDYVGLQHGDVSLAFQRAGSLHEDAPELAMFSTPAMSGSLYILVDSVETVLESIQGVLPILRHNTTTWYGMEEVYLQDNNGYLLCFAAQIKA